MATVEVTTGDLLDQDVEAIVNAWNRNIIPWWLLLPQGVSWPKQIPICDKVSVILETGET